MRRQRDLKIAAGLVSALFIISALAGCAPGQSSQTEAENAGGTGQDREDDLNNGEQAGERPRVSFPEYTGDLAPLEHGDPDQVDQVSVFGEGGAYADTDFSTPDDFTSTNENVDYGTLLTVTYHSDVIDADKEANVVLPPGYDESESYPVLYLLHGYNGGPGEWDAAQTVVGNLEAKNEMPKAILVQPDLWTSTASKEENTALTDWIDAFEDFHLDLLQDLMPYIESNFAAATGKDNTAIIGLSLGGEQALSIAFNNPGVFGYVAGLAPTLGAIDTPEAEAFTSPTLDALNMENDDDIPYYVMLNYGSNEPYDKAATNEYRKSLTENGIPNAFFEVKGAGHDGDTWVPGLYNFAGRIFRN